MIFDAAKKLLTFIPKLDIMIWQINASVAQSVVHLTRNEKVACSSQVTSSKKDQLHPELVFFVY